MMYLLRLVWYKFVVLIYKITAKMYQGHKSEGLAFLGEGESNLKISLITNFFLYKKKFWQSFRKKIIITQAPQLIYPLIVNLNMFYYYKIFCDSQIDNQTYGVKIMNCFYNVLDRKLYTVFSQLFSQTLFLPQLSKKHFKKLSEIKCHWN